MSKKKGRKVESMDNQSEYVAVQRVSEQISSQQWLRS